MNDPRVIHSIETSLLSAFKLYQDGNPRIFQLWVNRIYNLDQAGLARTVKDLHQLIVSLEEIAKDWSKTRSWYNGDYGEGYDSGKHSAGDTIAELLDTHKNAIAIIKAITEPCDSEKV